jgi:hypothetical protein
MRASVGLGLTLLVAAACVDTGRPTDPGTVDDPGPDDGTPPDPDDPNDPVDPALPPVLDRVRPDRGSVEGGTFVTLRGDNLSVPAQVFFGDAEAPVVTLLDRFAFEVQTPPNPEGFVDVRVVTPTGTATLAEAFLYEPVFEITDIEPSRIPSEGGVEVTVRGRGFTPNTLVLFDRTPLSAARRISEEEIVGIAPPVRAGRVRARALNNRSQDERKDLVVAFPIPEVAAAAPASVAPAGDVVELSGQGFSEVTEVRFDGIAGQILDLTEDRIRIETPALAPGPVTITLDTPDVVRTFPGRLASRSASPFALVAAVPPSTVAGPGVTVVLVGSGFDATTTASFDGVPLPVVDASASELAVEIPAGLGVGAGTLRVASGALEATLTDGLELVAPIQLTAIVPGFADADAETRIEVQGTGLSSVTRLRLGDVFLTDLEVVDDNNLEGTVVGGRHGPANLVADGRGGQRLAAAGFRFEEPFEILQADPPDGAIAGNTLVTVYGRGFDGPVGVTFGGADGTAPELENGSVIAVRSPAGLSGEVDLEVEASERTTTLPLAYAYFDPRAILGGGFGGPVDGDLNVSVLGFDRQPIPGAVVQVGYDLDPQLQATTNADGIAVISTRDLEGPLTVTAGRTGNEFVTFYDVDNRNLTALSAPNAVAPNPDAPPPLCPQPATPPTIQGRVFGLKSELDPNAQPDIRPVVTVTYSDRDAFTPNPAMPPEQVTQVFDEGGEFTIVTTRVGTVAVFALLEEINLTTGERRPVRLGIARGVPVAPNQTTEGVIVDMTIDLDQTFEVRLDDPPEQFPGPGINAVFPFLNLGSDGVIPFPAQALASDTVVLENMPQLAQSQFIYLAGSFSIGPTGGLAAPWSLNVQETVEGPDQDADIGPFLNPPQNINPKAGELLQNRLITFDREGATPDLSITNFIDGISFISCCCPDVNQNGVCEEGFEEDNIQCGFGGQSFNRWSLYGPGDRTSIELPPLPPGAEPFETPKAYSLSIQQALAPRFTFDEFNFQQFSPFFWQSWTNVQTTVLIKEDTD